MQTSSLRFLVVFQNLSFASCLSQFPVNRPPAKPRCPLRCHFLPTLLRNQLVTLPVSQIIADWKQQNATDAVQKNRAICSDVWKRHSLAPATRHMNTQDQGRRQQETHTPTAKTIYRRNVRSPTTRHRIRNEKRARNQR